MTTCQACKEMHGEDMEKCEACGGTGEEQEEFCEGCSQYYPEAVMIRCDHCDERYCNKESGADCIGDHIEHIEGEGT